MEEVKRTQEAVEQHLRSLNNSDLVQAHNQSRENANDMDSQIFENDEDFFDTHFNKAIDAVRAAHFGTYNYSDNFVTFNGYANLESFDNVEDNVDISEIAADILENEQDYDIELIDVFNCEMCEAEMEEEEHDFCDVCPSCRDGE